MSRIIAAIDNFARTQPDQTALRDNTMAYSYFTLANEIRHISQRLGKTRVRRMGLLMDNSIAWSLIDLASQAAGITVVPLPGFFSDDQIRHTVQDASLDITLTDQPQRLMHILEDVRLRPMPHIGGKNIWALEHPPTAHRPGLTDIAKITYTSGTTGAPKGVCLSPRTLDTVSESLNRQIDGVPGDRHLCLMPLSILLENVGGLYLSMLSGGECYLPGPGETGVGGSSEVDADKLVSIIRNSKAGRIILTPQLLHILVSKIERGYSLPTLKFVAVGGAPLSTNLLRRAVRCGLPVFEGYGLSECGSVVAVNTTTHNKPGSVGRPLPHVELRFGCDGEIFVKGTLFKNYLGTTPATKNGFFATGDIGYLDTDGYLFITGRKKNMFITSFGRNVAPEWVENELALQPSIAQAVVFGEGRPWSTAVIVPRSAAVGHSEPELDYAIHTVNEQLPDYARIGAWITADEPFSLANDQFTATGRPRRQAIWARYASRIDAIYHTESRNKRSL